MNFYESWHTWENGEKQAFHGVENYSKQLDIWKSTGSKLIGCKIYIQKYFWLD